MRLLLFVITSLKHIYRFGRSYVDIRCTVSLERRNNIIMQRSNVDVNVLGFNVKKLLLGCASTSVLLAHPGLKFHSLLRCWFLALKKSMKSKNGLLSPSFAPFLPTTLQIPSGLRRVLHLHNQVKCGGLFQ